MPNNRTPIPVSAMPALQPAEATAPSTLFAQHIALFCDADLRTSAKLVRELADIANAHNLANAYASQRVTL